MSDSEKDKHSKHSVSEPLSSSSEKSGESFEPMARSSMTTGLIKKSIDELGGFNWDAVCKIVDNALKEHISTPPLIEALFRKELEPKLEAAHPGYQFRFRHQWYEADIYTILAVSQDKWYRVRFSQKTLFEKGYSAAFEEVAIRFAEGLK